jgi:hypothetical protein
MTGNIRVSYDDTISLLAIQTYVEIALKAILGGDGENFGHVKNHHTIRTEDGLGRIYILRAYETKKSIMIDIGVKE